MRFEEKDEQVAIRRKLADGKLWRRRVRKHDPKNFAVHGELVLQLIERRGLALKNDVHVKARIVLLVRHAAERLLIHLLHCLDLAARGGDFSRDLVDGIFDALFFSCGIQYEQTFVSFHCSSLSFSGSTTTPLN